MPVIKCRCWKGALCMPGSSKSPGWWQWLEMYRLAQAWVFHHRHTSSAESRRKAAAAQRAARRGGLPESYQRDSWAPLIHGTSPSWRSASYSHQDCSRTTPAALCKSKILPDSTAVKTHMCAMEIRGTPVDCLIKHIILMQIKHYCNFLDKFPEVERG